ncbi:MAG: beta-ketoacyl synthase chain length factor, partial [Sulfuriferula sp.]
MTTTVLTAYINGIGLLGPGLTGWADSQAILAGTQTYISTTTALPSPSLLPAAERRRCGGIVKVTLATGLEASTAAGLDPAMLACVYSASGSDGQNCHEICLTLASADRHISPTRFHNSVHNAAAG